VGGAGGAGGGSNTSSSQTPNIVSLRHSRVGSQRMVNASL